MILTTQMTAQQLQLLISNYIHIAISISISIRNRSATLSLPLQSPVNNKNIINIIFNEELE